MIKIRIFVSQIVCASFFFISPAFAQGAVDFWVDASTHVRVSVEEDGVIVKKTKNGSIFERIIPKDSEKKISIKVGDFDFDGVSDFQFSHLDEGKGVYTIHRVFLYSKKNEEFIEAFPKCGDEFINLQINKIKKALISTYYVDCVPKLCQTRFARRVDGRR